LPDALHARLSSVVPFAHGYPREWMEIAHHNITGHEEC
jgi:hypothetical protein